MKLNDTGLDRVKTFGQPYHGLWKAGSIALPNGTSKTCPAPASGGVVLLRVPGQPAVSRTAPELAADAAAGREWRNYGLISGGRYGALGLPQFSGEGVVFFIDAAKKCWLMRVYTDPGMVNYMTVRLRRVGLINGTTDSGWSAAINVSISSDFVAVPFPAWLPGRQFVVVSQNTTGRQFVVGYKATSSDGYAWCDALAEISVSGTVDLSAAGFGLTFSHQVIEWQQRSSRVVSNTSSSSSGVCHHEKTWTYVESPSNNTYARTVVWEDGIVVSDDGPGPTVSGNWSIDFGAPTNEVKWSSKIFSFSSVIASEFYIWAAYENDDLKLVRVKFVESRGGAFPANTLDQGLWSTGPTVHNVEFRFLLTYGEHVIRDDTYLKSGDGAPVDYISEMSGNFGDNTTFYNHASYASNSGAYGYASGLFSMGVEADGSWDELIVSASGETPSSAVIRYGHRTVTPTQYGHYYAPFVKDSLYCPSGLSQAVSGGLLTDFATWQPVTDQLAVDSVPICWF